MQNEPGPAQAAVFWDTAVDLQLFPNFKILDKIFTLWPISNSRKTAVFSSY